MISETIHSIAFQMHIFMKHCPEFVESNSVGAGIKNEKPLLILEINTAWYTNGLTIFLRFLIACEIINISNKSFCRGSSREI